MALQYYIRNIDEGPDPDDGGVLGTLLNMTFQTENTAYRIENGHLTRIDPSEPLRRDGEPIRIIEQLSVAVGRPAVFLLDLREDGVPTLRVTSNFLTASRG